MKADARYCRIKELKLRIKLVTVLLEYEFTCCMLQYKKRPLPQRRLSELFAATRGCRVGGRALCLGAYSLSIA